MRSHDRAVKGEDLQPRGCGFESWQRIPDGMSANLTIIYMKENKGNSQKQPKTAEK